MTALAKRSSGLSSKKGRQLALENKINEIDARLKDLGVADMKYHISVSITNPEASQNTVNISVCSELGWLRRVLAHYKNMLHYDKQFCKDAGIEVPLLMNVQGIQIQSIVHDLELRIVYLTHLTEINRLTAIKEELLPFMNEESRFISALKKVEELLNS